MTERKSIDFFCGVCGKPEQRGGRRWIAARADTAHPKYGPLRYVGTLCRICNLPENVAAITERAQDWKMGL